jgi:hypothetical protein
MLTVTGAVLASAPASAVSFSDVTGTARVNRSGESYGASFGDMNGDGYLDLYTSNHRQQDNLYLNLNGKQFYRISSQVLSWQNHKNADTHGATFADIENDGDQDLFISTGTGNLSMMLFNENQRLVDRAAQKGWTTITVGGRQPVWLDYNGDKLLDFVMTQMAGNGKVYQQGAGSNFNDMTSIAKFICTNFHYGHLYDANDDGQLDFLCPDQTIFPQRIYDTTAMPWTKIFEANNTGQTWFPRIPGVVDSVVADFNNDGREDIFLLSNTQLHPSGVAQSSSTHFESLLANGTKGFTFVSPGRVSIKPDWNSADREWEVVDLSRILIGEKGVHPSSINFTLDPTSPNVVGVPPIPTSETAYPIMRIWYTPSTQRWTLMIHSKLNSTTQGGFSVAYLQVDSTSAITGLQRAGDFWPGDSPARPTLLMNRSGSYIDETVNAGLGKPISCVSATAGDFDNDMHVDLYLACRTGASNLANIMYRNLGNGTFQQVSSNGAAGPVGVAVASGAGTADSVISGDYDVDGFLDLFVTNGLNLQPRGFGGPSKLYHNNGNANRWVEVDLVGTRSDRDATGARVYATAAGVTQLRTQNGRYHRWSQDAKRAHFGLGGASSVTLRVEWPSGTVQTHSVAANKLYRITESTATTPGRIDPVNVGAAPAYPCGAPALNGWQDKGVYVWRDCPSGKWILRVLSANTTITYEGTVTSTSNFTSIKPQGLETGDVLNTSNTKQISFNFISKGTGIDGVDFKLPDGANACLKVPVPSSAQVYMGPFKKPISKPTNLETQGPC